MQISRNIKKLMQTLDVSDDETKLYIHLLQKGMRTALDLSSETSFSRTQIYSLLDSLIEKGLVVEVLRENGRGFEAAPPDNLKGFLTFKQRKYHSLEQALPEIIDSLSMVTRENITKSKIKYYSGIKGLKQVVWNETKSKGIFRIYEIEKIQAFLDEKFASEVLLEFVKNQIMDRQLTNIKDYEAYTGVEEFVNNWWEIRYIDPEDLNINFETKIYNNVYCIYDFTGGKVFCVEIYNENLAEMQKQIFDFVWHYAKPMKIVDPKGRAVLNES
jgi:sugar-specific transcriptional regulator TrmB